MRPARRRSRFTSQRATASSPAVSTIWRILTDRGFVTPQPHKRPKSSYVRFAGRAAQRTLAGRHHPLAAGRRHRRRDPQHHRRPLPAVPRQRRPPGVQGPDVDRCFRQAAADLRQSGQPAHRQRRRVHRPLPRPGRVAPRAHPAQPRHQLPPLPALPPADLRQSRTLPPDPQEMARQHSPAPHHRANYKPSSTPSAATTTPSAPPRPRPTHTPARPTTPDPKPSPPAPRSTTATTASATTRIDTDGKLTLRHNSRLHHIGIGRRHAGTDVLSCPRPAHPRSSPPTANYSATSTSTPAATTNHNPNRERCPKTPVHDVPRHRSGGEEGTRTHDPLLAKQVL